ncbi:hypothetical protein CPC08DRAFT_316319 [Agrocybe pediades]|nr:hypothetical protein CPC08DRAFT_316319 [Agrocybe pediades]
MARRRRNVTGPAGPVAAPRKKSLSALSKPALQALATQFELPSDGTVNALRTTIAEYLEQNYDNLANDPEFGHLYPRNRRKNAPQPPHHSPSPPPPVPPPAGGPPPPSPPPGSAPVSPEPGSPQPPSAHNSGRSTSSREPNVPLVNHNPFSGLDAQSLGDLLTHLQNDSVPRVWKSCFRRHLRPSSGWQSRQTFLKEASCARARPSC